MIGIDNKYFNKFMLEDLEYLRRKHDIYPNIDAISKFERFEGSTIWRNEHSYFTNSKVCTSFERYTLHEEIMFNFCVVRDCVGYDIVVPLDMLDVEYDGVKTPLKSIYDYTTKPKPCCGVTPKIVGYCTNYTGYKCSVCGRELEWNATYSSFYGQTYNETFLEFLNRWNSI